MTINSKLHCTTVGKLENVDHDTGSLNMQYLSNVIFIRLQLLMRIFSNHYFKPFRSDIVNPVFF